MQTPADTPYGVAIGGTSLNVDSNGNWTGESYWNNSLGAGSGGVSVVFREPIFQKMASIVASGRALPDLSFDANYISGESIVFDGVWYGDGGTSLASPIFGGCTVELEQVLGGRVTSYANQLYGNWTRYGYGSGSTVYAHDIIGGKPFGILEPGPGYDLATGIGSLDCFIGGQQYLYAGGNVSAPASR